MKAALLLAAVVLLAGCGRHEAATPGVRQTGFPGMVTAGGHTSGAVMAANTPGGAVHPGPAGTPGIPGGAGGNPGGAALGNEAPKTTDLAAKTTAPAGAASAPVAAASAPLSAASAAALAAQRAKESLERVQDVVAARWHARVASGALPPASATRPVQVVVKSEKLGTAPPSPDVKTMTKPATPAVLDRQAPAAAGPKP